MRLLPPCWTNKPPKPNHAKLQINGPSGAVVSILNDECYKCSFWDTCVLDGSHNEILVSSYYPNTVKLTFENETISERTYLRCKGYDYGYPVIERPSEERPRALWLDAMRGYALIMMIFVNYGGGGLALYQHSAWYGLTIADCVFPLFLFCSGCAMYYTHDHMRIFPKSEIWKQIFRCARLIFYGIILSNFQDTPIRLPGVLQRIGIVVLLFYLQYALCVVAIMHLTNIGPYQHTDWYLFVGVFIGAIDGLLYFVFFLNIYMIPYNNGCPIVYQGPGGISEMGQYFNCTGGLIGAIDRLVFQDLIYKTPTSVELYHNTMSFDPEGLVTTLAAAVTFCSGFCGIKILHSRLKNKHCYFGGITSSCLVLGVVFHFFLIPFNKNLWSFSYILINVTIDNILLLGFYLLHKEHTFRFKTLQCMGRHSLVIYMVHEICYGRFPAQFHVDASSTMQMLNASWGVIFHVLLALMLEAGNFRVKYNIRESFSIYQAIIS